MVTACGPLYSRRRKEVKFMCDAGDILSGGLPVYSITKDLVETVARGCGMDDDDAKALGIAVGAGVSITTALTTGCP
jgi:hypothetical protein